MNKNLQSVALAAAVVALAACSSSATPLVAAPAPSTPASVPAAPALTPPGTPANLSPLVVGQFPDTADGQLAKAICEQWSGLRQQYVDNATTDSPYQMNQWFSSSAWSKIQDDANTLNGDPAYSNLQTALGVGLVGDEAGAGSAAAIDKACMDAD